MSKQIKHMSGVIRLDGQGNVLEVISKQQILNRPTTPKEKKEIKKPYCFGCIDYDTPKCLECKPMQEYINSFNAQRSEHEVIAKMLPYSDNPDYKQHIHNTASVQKYKELSNQDKAIIVLKLAGFKKATIAKLLHLTFKKVTYICNKFE